MTDAPNRPPMTRRDALKWLGASAAAVALPTPWSRGPWVRAADAGAAGGTAGSISFFFVSDTHFLANKDKPEEMDERSATATSRLIEVLNKLPGTPIPESAGGGVVAEPRGVIHGGDCIDSGDKASPVHLAMQKTEWKHFCEAFGLNGKDGKLRFPVYEVHGNHDSPSGKGLAIDGIIERNKRRAGLAGVSEGGLHYSWDWGAFHLANLGIVVGSTPENGRRRRYHPVGSYDFLKADLEKNVGRSGRPVILTHHIDLLRYSTGCDPEAPFAGKEWDPCDVAAYHKLLADYNVVAILFGHTHVRDVFRWDGTTKKAADAGYDLFNVDESSHFSSVMHGIFQFEFTDQKMTVREYATKDNWQTAQWTQAWTRPIKVPAAKA